MLSSSQTNDIWSRDTDHRPSHTWEHVSIFILHTSLQSLIHLMSCPVVNHLNCQLSVKEIISIRIISCRIYPVGIQLSVLHLVTVRSVQTSVSSSDSSSFTNIYLSVNPNFSNTQIRPLKFEDKMFWWFIWPGHKNIILIEIFLS